MPVAVGWREPASPLLYQNVLVLPGATALLYLDADFSPNSGFDTFRSEVFISCVYDIAGPNETVVDVARYEVRNGIYELLG